MDRIEAENRIRSEIDSILTRYGVEQGCIPIGDEMMDVMRKAWIFGYNAGYRETRDDISNGMYFN